MITLLYVFALCFGLIGAFYKRRIKWVEVLIIGILIYLMGRGAKTLDTMNYFWWYQNAPAISFSDTYEKGYLFLMKLGQSIGLDYIQFRFLMLLASFILVRKSISKLTTKTLFVYFFYFLFLIFIDTVQIRNFFAFSIVLYGMHFLLTKHSRAVTYFIMCTIIATSIHIGSIFALVFVLIKLKSRNALIRIIITITLMMSLLIFVAGNKFTFLRKIFELLQSETDTQRLEGYINGHTSLGFLYPFLLTALNISMIYIVKRVMMRNCSRAIRMRCSETALATLMKKRDIIDGIYLINLISIVFFPFYMLNVQFVRLARNLIMINLIGISIVQKPILKLNSSMICRNIGMIIYLSLWFYYTFILAKHVEDILIPFFDIAVF